MNDDVIFAKWIRHPVEPLREQLETELFAISSRPEGLRSCNLQLQLGLALCFHDGRGPSIAMSSAALTSNDC